MGSFYTQVIVAEPEAQNCARVMRSVNRPSFVIPSETGITVVCDRASEEQDVDVLDSVSRTLASRLRTSAVALLNHDDDWLVLRYFKGDAFLGGLQVGHTPLSLRGSVITLRTLLRPSASIWALYVAFLKPYVLQSERHARIAEVLKLPSRSIGHGFRYISQRNFSGPFEMEGVIEVADHAG